MNEPITITEVVGRAVQGMTKPFLCKAGFFDYYVKGAYAGKNSLCCEWVANRLVNRALPSAPLGLPMFEMVEVPLALIEESGFPDIREGKLRGQVGEAGGPQPDAGNRAEI